MAYFAYVLVSEKTGRRYVGSTQDVHDRLRRHNAMHNKATKAGVPWRLVHVESFETRADAVQREMFLKSGQGRAWLDSAVA